MTAYLNRFFGTATPGFGRGLAAPEAAPVAVGRGAGRSRGGAVVGNVGAAPSRGRGFQQAATAVAANTAGATAGQAAGEVGRDSEAEIVIDPAGFHIIAKVGASEGELKNLTVPDWLIIEVENKVPDYPYIIGRLGVWLDATAKALHTSLTSNNALALDATAFTYQYVRTVVFNGFCVFANCVGDGALNPAKGRGFTVKFRKVPHLSYDKGGELEVLISHLVVGKMIDRGLRTRRSVTIYRLAAVTYQVFASWAVRTRYVPNWFPVKGVEHTVPYAYRSLANTTLAPVHAEADSALLLREAFDYFMLTHVPEDKRGRYARDPTLEAQIARALAAPQALTVFASPVGPKAPRIKARPEEVEEEEEEEEPEEKLAKKGKGKPPSPEAPKSAPEGSGGASSSSAPPAQQDEEEDDDEDSESTVD